MPSADVLDANAPGVPILQLQFVHLSTLRNYNARRLCRAQGRLRCSAARRCG